MLDRRVFVFGSSAALFSGKSFSQAIDTHYEYCIVGAGHAGLSLALSLSKKTNGNAKILIIESGNDLIGGKIKEKPYKEDYDECGNRRTRTIFGTSSKWVEAGGQLIPLQSIDFANIGDFSNASGAHPYQWPVSFSEAFEGYYDEALSYFGFNFNYKRYIDSQYWQMKNKKPRKYPRPIGSTASFYPVSFGRVPHSEENGQLSQEYKIISDSLSEYGKNITFLSGVHAQKVLCSHDDPTKAISLETNVGRIKADVYILCGGSISNAEILLRSQDINNFLTEHEKIGRYYMEHVEVALCEVTTAPGSPTALHHFAIKNNYDQIRTEDDRMMRSHWASNLTYLSKGNARNCKFYLEVTDEKASNGKDKLKVLLMSEHIPLEDSYIRDHWKKTWCLLKGKNGGHEHVAMDVAAESAALKNAYDTIYREFGPSGNGWFDFLPRSGGFNPTVDRHHQMGTTRMSNTHHDGVVDGNCLVHGTRNLFVSSSSVFVRGGAGSPTLSIVALSCRLATRLAELRSP